MDEPYFQELTNLSPSNKLYKAWIDYALTLSREDVLTIVRQGLTHQANGLRSMLREIIAGNKVSKRLLAKIEIVATATRKQTEKLR
jgi:hypothetical protein